MIQRIQSVYLFIAAIICVLFVFVTIGKTDTISIATENNTITSGLSIAAALLSLVAIFLYKNRRLQVRICFIIIALLFIAMAHAYFVLSKTDPPSTITYFIATPFVAVLFLFLALRSIRKDEQLVKSMDRFR